MWKPGAEASWEETIKFDFDASLRYLLHIKEEKKDRQMDKHLELRRVSGLEEQLWSIDI